MVAAITVKMALPEDGITSPYGRYQAIFEGGCHVRRWPHTVPRARRVIFGGRGSLPLCDSPPDPRVEAAKPYRPRIGRSSPRGESLPDSHNLRDHAAGGVLTDSPLNDTPSGPPGGSGGRL
jgi:hypothetical protein